MADQTEVMRLLSRDMVVDGRPDIGDEIIE